MHLTLVQVIPEDKKPYAARGMPNACSCCSERFSERHQHTCEVMHGGSIMSFHML